MHFDLSVTGFISGNGRVARFRDLGRFFRIKNGPAGYYCRPRAKIAFPHTQRYGDKNQRCEVRHGSKLGASRQPDADGHKHVHGIHWLFE